MSLDHILDMRDRIKYDVLSFVDADYTTKRSKRDVEKSLRDIHFSITFTIEGLRMKSVPLIENYFRWMIETLKAYAIEETIVHKVFEGIKTFIQPHLDDATIALLNQVDISQSIASVKPIPTPYDQEKDTYLTHLLDKDRAKAQAYIHALIEKGINLETIYIDIIQPAMYDIGRLWQTRQITVADEHLATIITQTVMTTLYPIIFSTEKTGKKVLASAIGSELHEIGIRMVADLFEYSGYETQYMGANVPPEVLVKQAEIMKPDLIALGVTMAFHLSALQQTIAAIKKSDTLKNTKIIVGGQPFNVQPDLAEKMGADAYAKHARDAVKVGDRLV